ncbi:MAG: hypothetical protein N3D73_02295 [Candidatus Diapherotrites archaeon]|nr:hypothetical protein [Candidatus Diapherotrites archaeon]
MQSKKPPKNVRKKIKTIPEVKRKFLEKYRQERIQRFINPFFTPEGQVESIKNIFQKAGLHIIEEAQKVRERGFGKYYEKAWDNNEVRRLAKEAIQEAVVANNMERDVLLNSKNPQEAIEKIIKTMPQNLTEQEKIKKAEQIFEKMLNNAKKRCEKIIDATHKLRKTYLEESGDKGEKCPVAVRITLDCMGHLFQYPYVKIQRMENMYYKKK